MQIFRNLSSQPLWRVLIVFFFFSVADLYLTWHLIERQTGDVVESNPLAAIVLTSYGWLGLAGYKLALVMTFFGLSLAVERRRPVGGLLLLVFACGVHAAVVTSSAFLCLGDNQEEVDLAAFESQLKQNRQLLPEGSQGLLIQKSVQLELKLTDAQIREVIQITKKRRELSREMNQGHLENCRSMLMLVSSYEHKFASELTQKQIRRLDQLALQKRGVFALEDADVMIALDLTDEQRNDVLGIFEQVAFPPTQARGRPMEHGVPSDFDGTISEMKSKLLSVLTDIQKERWIAMQGVPFCFRTGTSLVVATQ